MKKKVKTMISAKAVLKSPPKHLASLRSTQLWMQNASADALFVGALNDGLDQLSRLSSTGSSCDSKKGTPLFRQTQQKAVESFTCLA